MGLSSQLAASSLARPGVCTSSTRPASPYTGQIIYETDTGYLRVWDGAAWDYLSQKQDDTTNFPVNTIGAAWQNWTPRVDQNVTISSATNYARYCQIQKSVFATAYVTLSGTGTAGAAIAISLPLTAQSNSGQMIAYGWFYDASVVTFYNLTGYGLSPTTVAFISPNATGGSFGTNPAVTASTSDQLRIAFMYEAA